MRKILFLMFSLCVSLLAFAQEYDFVSGGIYYKISTDNSVGVTYKDLNYNSYSGDVVIPESVTNNGTTYSVTTISDKAFYKCANLKSITIPNSVSLIGNHAFFQCSGLTSVSIPNNVSSIGEYVFYQCKGLKSITIGNSVTSISNFAFYGCSSLAEVTISESASSIGYYSFAFCSALKGITIPNSVTSIGSNAFSNCSGLTSVTIPYSVTVIKSNAFMDCSNLTSIQVDARNTNYDSRDNCNAIIETATNKLVAGCMNTTIPNKVSAIGDFAFCGRNGLTSIAIPNSVTSIGRSAFAITSLTSIEIPNSVKLVGKCAFEGCEGLTVVDFPNSVKNIEDRAFYGCLNIQGITIGSGIELIGALAFKNCPKLNFIKVDAEIPPACKGDIVEDDQYNTISLEVSNNSYASTDIWNKFKNIQIVSLGAGSAYDFEHEGIYYKISSETDKTVSVTSGDSKYSGSVTIPSSVTHDGITYSVTGIADKAFEECVDLTSIEIPNSITIIGDYAFENCLSLASVNIPNGVKYINDGVFSGCGNLLSITIPNSVDMIGESAFYNCGSLLTVEIPNSVTFISDQAFYRCRNLTSLKLGNRVEAIGVRAFTYCNSLTSVEIPSSVYFIGALAFKGCSSLESVSIGSGAEWIGAYTFSELENLKVIRIETQVPPACERDIVDDELYNTISLEVPNNSYANVDIWNKFKNIQVTSLGSWTDYDFEKDGIYYKIATDNTVRVTTKEFDPNTYSGNVVIPESVTYDGTTYSVIMIGDYAFSGCSGLTSVTIPNSVTGICQSAFENCIGLTSIEIPSSVKFIESVAFMGCSNLQSITIGSGIEKIGVYAFYGCTNLSVIKVEAEVAPTCEYDIVDNQQYNSIILEVPNNMYAIADIWEKFKNIQVTSNRLDPRADFEQDGFYYNITSDQTVSVTYKDENYNSYSGDVKIPTSVMYEGETYNVTEIDDLAFNDCINLKSVEIPNSVTIIRSFAFRGCGLQEMEIPNFITAIGVGLFKQCPNLTSVTVGNGVKRIRSQMFHSCSKLASITFNNKVIEEVEKNAFSFSYNLQSITLGSEIESIAPNAFNGIRNLKVIRILAKVPPTCVGDIVDDEQYNDVILEVPNNRYASAEIWEKFKNIQVVSIGLNSAYDFEVDGIYYDVTSDTDKTVSVTDGYSNNSGSITVPSSVTNESITYSVTEISESAFEGKSDLTSLEIPNTVTSIGAYAFYDCKLVEVKVAATNPPTIQENTFSDYSATLYVPKDCVQTYSTAPIWQNFTNIKEWDAGVTGVKVDSNSAVPVDYYDLNGVRYAEPQRGINIVRYSDGTTKKDIVK